MIDIKTILPYLAPYRKQFILGPIFKFLEALFELFIPLIMARIVDEGIVRRDTGYVLRMGGVMLLLTLIAVGCALICQYYASVASQGAGTKLREAVFRKVMALSAGDVSKLGAPTVMNRLTGDVNQLQLAVAMLIRLAVRAPFLTLGGLVMAFIIDARLSLILVVAIPLYCLALWWVSKAAAPLYKSLQGRLDALALAAREHMLGVRVIRAFAMRDAERRRMEGAAGELRETALKAGRISFLLSPLTAFILNAGIAAILWFGAFRVDAGGMTGGEIIAYINYIGDILVALTVVSNLAVIFTRAAASLGRVSELLEMEPSVADAADRDVPRSSNPAIPRDSAIAFENVSFSYGGADALSGITFSAHSGSRVGVVGGTGAGKSTLARLIARLYDANEGTVSVGGVNVTDVPMERLRGQIALVEQSPVLFSGTIADNLRLGKPDAVTDDLRRAAEAAQALEFIDALPDGMDARVERGGRNLSGGQRQRLAVARGLVKQPGILILDDASSALDYATDRALRAAISALDESMTVVIISQRLRAVRDADTILVLDDGCLIAQGTHAHLLETCGEYREMARAQGVPS